MIISINYYIIKRVVVVLLLVIKKFLCLLPKNAYVSIGK